MTIDKRLPKSPNINFTGGVVQAVCHKMNAILEYLSHAGASKLSTSVVYK